MSLRLMQWRMHHCQTQPPLLCENTRMSAQIIDGKAIAQDLRREVRAGGDSLRARGRRPPGLRPRAPERLHKGFADVREFRLQFLL